MIIFRVVCLSCAMQNVITGTSYTQNCKFTWCLMGIRSGRSHWGGYRFSEFENKAAVSNG